MRFYHIKDDYINYLRNYDSKVALNKHERRPYVGVVVQIGDIAYYAPFTSPKPKHQYMKNAKDFRKIAGGSYGAINFNNMIPVPVDALLLIDINNEPDPQYRRLLQNQYRAVVRDRIGIEKTACMLRSLILTDTERLTPYDKKVKERCCDLQLLERIYNGYSKTNV